MTALAPLLAAAEVPDMATLLPGPLWLGMIVVAVIFVGLISVGDIYAVWLERKVSAAIQCRVGPMDVGFGTLFTSLPSWLGGGIFRSLLGGTRVPFQMWLGGLAQTIADGAKLLAKEDIIPANADRPMYIIGPIIVFLGVFGWFLVLPLGPNLIGSDLDVGLFYVAAIGSLEAIGVMMSGWASNNKWSLFGTMRTATQVVSYEIPLSLAFLAVIACAGTFSMMELCDQQRGGFWRWYVLANPFTLVAFVIYYIAALAQVKRAPFDLPEAESELVSGFHTEYSGMRFSIFFLSEYAAMFAVSTIAAVVFFGGYYIGLWPGWDEWMYANRGSAAANAIGFVVIAVKTWIGVALQMVLRWTLPRIRLDQVMHLCLKVLLPFSIACVVGASLCQLLRGDHSLMLILGR